MYLTHNEGKSVVTQRFVRISQNKIYRYITLISKNVHIANLDEIVNKYSNIHHRTIKMQPADVKSSKYIKSSKEINDKDPKFEIGDIARYFVFNSSKSGSSS